MAIIDMHGKRIMPSPEHEPTLLYEDEWTTSDTVMSVCQLVGMGLCWAAIGTIIGVAIGHLCRWWTL